MDMTPEALEVDSGGDALAAAVERVVAGATVVVARSGEPVAALVGLETLRSLQSERELLRRLALGELESAGGEGEALDAVLEDCRLLLEES